MIQKDVKLMQHYGDPRLKQAESSREVIRSEKRTRLMNEKVHAKQNEIFFHMTGITLEERTFRNMIDFYKSELMEIMKAADQSAAIRVLPKSDRRTMLHNGIFNGQRGSLTSWSITVRAKKYLAIV